jgi:hypothetical protein
MAEPPIDFTLERLTRLENLVKQRFDATDKRFDATDKRFDATDKRLDSIETSIVLHAHLSVLSPELHAKDFLPIEPKLPPHR